MTNYDEGKNFPENNFFIILGSCSSPNGHMVAGGVNPPYLPQNYDFRGMSGGISSRPNPASSSFVTSNSSFSDNPSENPSSPPPTFNPPAPGFNISNLTPSVPELTPTNSQGTFFSTFGTGP